ncbi:ubx [Metarhizium robertsii ARSEF 23]|uniref:Ubx n=1 Tax=Metarhizium robertsii (strain ARSEF 23 / ATCC MYA-3075) TaxID=655844 RepID=E9ET08_METRA|nr:ubx [Metarhizium robertsii ARSEF 23]EFZ01979.1 ubx [Metarhizium robertsii ARSEF 23]
MPSDLEALTEMGFDKTRAEIAIKKSGGLQGALQWLEDNQDKSLDEIQAEEASKEGEDDEEDAETKAKIAELETGQARSLICNECGKKFRNHDLATFHATKTDHTDFSESTEEIAPLTEDEKKAKLEELRERLKSKRAAQSVQDKEDAKRNEKIRQKSTKESQDLKEEIARKEQIKEAARKRQEKQDDIEAKKRIKAKIEADKAERRRKAEEAKAAREGRAPEAPANAPAPAAAAPPKPKADHNTARLRLQTPSGNLMKTLPAETTLFELAQLVQGETGLAVTSFSTTFPKQTFTGDLDMSKTLKEAGLVPSSVLIVQ